MCKRFTSCIASITEESNNHKKHVLELEVGTTKAFLVQGLKVYRLFICIVRTTIKFFSDYGMH